MGKAWEHLSHDVETRVDTKGGGIPNYKFVPNKPESEFLTG